MTALRALLRKELTELYLVKGQPRTASIVNLVLACVAGAGAALFIASVYGDGPGEVDSKVAALILSASIAFAIAAFLSLLGPIASAGEVVAGERERHTLETILASPVTRAQFVVAKVLAQIASAWASVALLCICWTIVATVLLGPVAILAGAVLLVVALAVATVVGALMCGLGLMVSAKADTTRQAQQSLMWVIFPLLLMPAFVSTAGMGAWGPLAVLGPGLYVVILGAVGWSLAVHRCRRSYLMAPGRQAQ